MLTVSTALDSAASPVLLEAASGGVPIPPVRIEDGQGALIGTIAPRAQFDAMAVDSVPAGSFRVVFGGPCQVRSIARLSVGGPAIQQWAGLTAARSQAGDVRSAISALDTSQAVLVGPDTLQMSFSAPAPSAGLVRDGFLGVDGMLLGGAGASATHLIASGAQPVRFALHQNAPNPFQGTTTIRFDLPMGQVVRLDIFDVSGRLARTLLNRFVPAGYQAVTWDQRDDAGAPVHAGVYFYRLHTDVFRDRRKMTLLP